MGLLIIRKLGQEDGPERHARESEKYRCGRLAHNSEVFVLERIQNVLWINQAKILVDHVVCSGGQANQKTWLASVMFS